MIRLSGDDVHLWYASLNDSRRSFDALAALLSRDELARAERFQSASGRRRFVVARGLLRRILSVYAGQAPDRIVFDYGPFGKPALRDHATLRFSLSHSGDMAVYAIARDRAVGVDLEALREIAGASAVAGRFFAPPEARELDALPPRQRARAFLECWTRKEAYLKATGLGCARPLDSFCVSLAPGDPPRLKWVAGLRHEPGRWSMADCRPTTAHVAALAVEGGDAPLTTLRWVN